MVYPAPNKIKELAEFINQSFGNHYTIWNISEKTYETSFFHDRVRKWKLPEFPNENKVNECNYVEYPCLPLSAIFRLCYDIVQWLNSDRKNVAIIHCDAKKGRSALLISSLLTIMKECKQPLEGLTYFCDVMYPFETQQLNKIRKPALMNNKFLIIHNDFIWNTFTMWWMK